MKKEENTKKDWFIKIQKNNLEIINYFSSEKIETICNTCKVKITDSARNLTYKKFKCKYCELTNKSDLIRNKLVDLIKIDSSLITLKCNKGHIYKQDRRNLLKNKKCMECYLQNKVFTKEKIINDLFLLHGDNYNYNFNDYKNIHSKIKIVCKKNHIFYQKVSNHLQGKGCPICRESFGERTITLFLENKNITYEKQKTFDDLFLIKKLKFDFYLPKYNIIIEYDGIQHFEAIEFLGGQKEFEKNKQRDLLKNDFCIKNNIKLIRISYKENILIRLKEIFIELENETFLDS